jgi:hypothetical protein
MKRLDRLEKELSSFPTVMDISDEISIIGDLMRLDLADIESNRESFCRIVRSVELSHTDSGYFELTKENEKIFIDFYRWLSLLRKDINLNLAAEIVENFNMTSSEFEKLMSKK